jgi:hypothetical protein
METKRVKNLKMAHLFILRTKFIDLDLRNSGKIRVKGCLNQKNSKKVTGKK